MKKYAITTHNLTKSFKDNHVLRGVNLNIEEGTIFALLGPNGAGKTTTVRILSTLLQPDSGEAKVGGFNVVSDAQKVRSIIGLTGQYAAVDEYLNAAENLRMMGRLYHLSHADAAKRADELLVQFDLVEAAKKPVKTFSGGMRRRLDLALSLIASPPILFLDEPTTGLDPRSRIVVWNTVKQLAKEGTTILLTTQYLEEADQLADHIAVVDGGTIIAEGTADELKRSVGSERLELSFASMEHAKKAAQLLKRDGLTSDKDRAALSLPITNGVHELQDVLDQLKKATITIESLSLHKPTLDDVFLQVTGHEATDAKTQE